MKQNCKVGRSYPKKVYQTIEDYVKNKAGVTKQEIVIFVNQNYNLKQL